MLNSLLDPSSWAMSAGLMSVFLFWGILMVVVFLVLKSLSVTSSGEDENPSLKILRERLARGEIDRREFDRKAAAIDKNHPL